MSDEFIQQYAQKFGRTYQEIHQYFVSEQERLAGLFSQSVMLKLRLNVDAASGSAIDAGYKFWTDD